MLICTGDERQKRESSDDADSGTSSKGRRQRSNEDEGTVDMIRRYLAEKLGIFDDDEKEVTEEKSKV